MCACASVPSRLSDELSDVEQWTYIHEGGVNIVFGAAAGGGAAQHALVLRIRKDDLGPKRRAHDADTVHAADYIAHVMRPLLGEDAVPPCRAVLVPRDLLAALLSRYAHARPLKRREKHPLDKPPALELVPALLTSDCTVAPGAALCIELKPKWGFLPQPLHTTDAASVKRVVCRGCMHQQLKICRGKLRVANAFCPLDLFSPNRASVERALRGLVEEPHNNLRVYFRDADNRALSVIQPSNTSAVSGALAAINAKDDLITVIADALLAPKGWHLMHRISSLQRLLDGGSSEGVATSLAALADHVSALTEADTAEWRASAVERINTALTNQSDPHPTCLHTSLLAAEDPASVLATSLKALPLPPTPPSPAAVTQLLDFLICQTLKDVSIMITLSADQSRIVCTDLDPKSPSKLEYYIRQDRGIAEHYHALVQQRILIPPKGTHCTCT